LETIGFTKNMKLIKPSFEIIEQKPRDIVIPADMEIGPQMWKDELINSVYRQIEVAGRTCYKSEDKITETSAKEFVDRMVKSGHGAMLEHGTVYLRIPDVSSDGQWVYPAKGKYLGNKYSVTKSRLEGVAQNPYSVFYVTTNYRVLVENNWLDDLQYICEPTEFHEKRVTVKFMCDRGVSHEFVRHRVFSFAQESTRYCNYSKDKFGKECTFIEPCWFKEDTYYATRKMYESTLTYAEKMYFSLLDMNWKPQQARAVLPNSLKTELIMTGTLTQWEGFFKLRDAGSAHPQAYELAHPLHEEFIKRGWIK
jgi:thymidylate synthase (FAD)